MNPDTVPDHYCQNLADRPGSDFHYSLLGLAQPQRRALNALQAFYLEATHITRTAATPASPRPSSTGGALNWNGCSAAIRNTRSAAPCNRT